MALHPVAEFDRRTVRVLRTSLRHKGVENAARALAFTGEYGAIWIVSALGAAALDRSRRRQWIIAAGMAPVAVACNFAVKLTVRRERPHLSGVSTAGRVPNSHSFPSAHASSSFAAAQAFSAVEPRLRAPATVVATLMALTRPYLGVHFPSDVVAGALLGTAVGVAAGPLLQAPSINRTL